AALAFDDDNFVVLILQDQLLRSAADEIGDDAVDRQSVAFDHDAGLAGGDELGVVAAFFQAVGDFDGDNHLADRAVVADGVHAEAVRPQALAAGDRLFAIPAYVLQRDAAGLGGFGEFGVVVQKIVQAADHVHLATGDGVENDRPPRRRNLPARRRNAEE